MMCDRHTGPGCDAPLLPGCPVWCMVLFLPVLAWHPLRDGLPGRTLTTPRVADLARMYDQGDLAKIRGLGPRRLAAIQQCLPASPQRPAGRRRQPVSRGGGAAARGLRGPQ
jgi:hypothetical protein